MIKDPLLEELWKIRDNYAAEFHYNIDAIYNDLKEKERQSGQLFVSSPLVRENESEQEEHVETV